MKLLMLVNPAAGRCRTGKVVNRVRAELKKNGVDVICRFSAYQGDLSRKAEYEVNGDWDGILSMGGDGTLFEVVNGMMRGNPEMPMPLGVIPCGSGNSFCMDLGIRSLSDAIKNIIGARRRWVDLGRCDCNGKRFYFINILGFGFVSDVVARALRFKRWGDASYVLGVFQAALQMQWYPMTFEIDGRRFHRENVFAEICNSTKTGGDMLMAPGARIDDGMLDVVLLNRISPPRILTCLPKIYKGSHLDMPEVDTFSGKQMVFRPAASKLLSPDGELYGSTPVRISVLPAKVCFFGS